MPLAGKRPISSWRHLLEQPLTVEQLLGSNRAAYGCIIGKNTLVIDIDNHKGSTANIDFFNKLLAAAGYGALTPEGRGTLEGKKIEDYYPVVLTGSGLGYHIYFNNPSGAGFRDIQALIDGEAVEVELKNGSQYVVIAGSAHSETGNSYKFIGKGWAVPRLPDIEPALLQQIRKYSPELGDIDSAGSTAALPEEPVITPEQLSEILAAIPSPELSLEGDYNSWVQLAFSIYSATAGADWGRDIFTKWSSSYGRYKGSAEAVRAVIKKWDTGQLSPEGRSNPITYRSIPALLREYYFKLSEAMPAEAKAASDIISNLNTGSNIDKMAAVLSSSPALSDTPEPEPAPEPAKPAIKDKDRDKVIALTKELERIIAKLRGKGRYSKKELYSYLSQIAPLIPELNLDTLINNILRADKQGIKAGSTRAALSRLELYSAAAVKEVKDIARDLADKIFKEVYKDGQELIKAQETLVHYGGKHWEAIGSVANNLNTPVNKYVDLWLDTNPGASVKKAKLCTETLTLLSLMIKNYPGEANPLSGHNRSREQRLNFNNTELIIDTTEHKIITRAHTPGSYFTYHLPHDYRPGAEAPKFMSFISSLMGGNKDNIQSLLEVLAVSLMPVKEYPAIVFLHGRGSNGKSALISVLEALAGAIISAKSVSAVTGNTLDTHIYEGLEGKSLMLSEEGSGSIVNSADVLKALSSGSYQDVNAKYKSIVKQFIAVTPMVSTNTLPQARDIDGGFLRRLIFIPFNTAFLPAEELEAKVKSLRAKHEHIELVDKEYKAPEYALAEPQLIRDILASPEELSGAISIIAESYLAVSRRGSIYIAPEFKRAKDNWLSVSSPYETFKHEYLEFTGNPADVLVGRDLFNVYKQFLADNSMSEDISNQQFYNKLIRSGGVKGHVRGQGNSIYIKGVKYQDSVELTDSSVLPF